MNLCGSTHTIQDNLSVIKMQALNIKSSNLVITALELLRCGYTHTINPYIYSEFHHRKTQL
jgi:hypothetical protein